MSRYAYVEYAKATVIGETAGKAKTYSARQRNKAVDKRLEEQRKAWELHPPSNRNILLHTDLGAFPGGLVLSVPHEVGRWLLHKHRYRCSIIEHDISIDAGIEGSFEDTTEALGWQQQQESSEHCGYRESNNTNRYQAR